LSAWGEWTTKETGYTPIPGFPDISIPPFPRPLRVDASLQLSVDDSQDAQIFLEDDNLAVACRMRNANVHRASYDGRKYLTLLPVSSMKVLVDEISLR
jgi:hypothetical protein